MGFDVVSVVTVEDDKAHYYAGASNFIIKLIADRKTLKYLEYKFLEQEQWIK